MQVDIPLHPISYKILQHQYGDANGVIHITAHSDIKSLFMINWKDWSSSNISIHQDYNSITTFKVTKKLSKIINRNAIKMACELYTRHRSLLLHFILGHVIGKDKGNAKAAIRLFYEIYGITDDDIDADTVYKAWTRWYAKWKKKKPILQLKPKVSRVGRVAKVISPLPREIADKKLGTFVQENIDKYMGVNGAIIVSLIHQLQAYVYLYHCLFKFDEIAKMQGKTVSGVKRRVYTFRDNIANDEELKSSYSSIFDIMKY